MAMTWRKNFLNLPVLFLTLTLSMPAWSAQRECYDRIEENGKSVEREIYFDSEYPYFSVTNHVRLPDGSRTEETSLLLSRDTICGVNQRGLRCRSKTLEIFGKLTHEVECEDKVKLKIKIDRRGQGQFNCQMTTTESTGSIQFGFSGCFD